jgi:hypothetical protein
VGAGSSAAVYAARGHERLPIKLLTQTNEHIRVVARAKPHAVLADVNLHFMGHGIHVAEAEQWVLASQCARTVRTRCE